MTPPAGTQVHWISLLVCILSLASFAFAQRGPGPSTRSASAFPGKDIGEQINAAYADLPVTGGSIMVTESASFHTPILFETKNKPALLIGLPGDMVTLTYLGMSGTALTFNYGTMHRMGHGLRDLTLSGPGHSSNTRGVMFGGSSGAQGIAFRDFKIQSFGTNLEMGSHTWLAYFEHGMVRDGGVNVLLPSGLTEAGEQIVFNHVTFADAPPPHTDSVWVQGGGQEVIFTDCSFDHAQLRIGNGIVSGAQVVVRGGHFENPNYDWPESVNYDYVTVDNHPGNYLRITESYLLQDCMTGGPARFMALNGGRIYMTGIGMYTPPGSPLENFAVLANSVSVEIQGFNDLSGNIAGPLLGRN